MFNFVGSESRPAGLPLLAVVFLASESLFSPRPAPIRRSSQPIRGGQPGPQARDRRPAPPVPPEIDLNLINLPTTLSLEAPSQLLSTHAPVRARPSPRRASDLAASLFSLDDGAVIGLEYRFAITGNLHAGVNRSMLARRSRHSSGGTPLRQGDALPVSVSVMGSYEGLNNMRELYQPGVAVTVSRTFGDALALYATPAFVADTHAVDIIAGHAHDPGTGGRARAPQRHLVRRARHARPFLAHRLHRGGILASARRLRPEQRGVGRSRSRNAPEATCCSSISPTRSARHSDRSRGAAVRTMCTLDSTSHESSDDRTDADSGAVTDRFRRPVT